MSLTTVDDRVLDKWTLKVPPAARVRATAHAETRRVTLGAWLAEAINLLADREDSGVIDHAPLALPAPTRAGFTREELELLEHMTRVAGQLEALSPESQFRKTALGVLEARTKALKPGKTVKTVDAASGREAASAVTTC